MKITDVETIVVANPPPSYGGRYFTFVKVVSSDGIVGWGEVYSGTFHPDVVREMAADVADRHLIGQDPFDTEAFWRRTYGRGFTMRPDLSLMGALKPRRTTHFMKAPRARGVTVLEVDCSPV